MSPPERLYGYRVWRTDSSGRLYSLRGPALLPFTAWSPDRPHRATCLRGFLPWGPGHRAPEEGCSCGLYAWKRPQKLGPSETAFSDPYGPHVVGVVQMWGKVIEHEHGYRAAVARPVALEWSELAEAASRRYGAVLLGSLGDWTGA